MTGLTPGLYSDVLPDCASCADGLVQGVVVLGSTAVLLAKRHRLGGAFSYLSWAHGNYTALNVVCPHLLINLIFAGLLCHLFLSITCIVECLNPCLSVPHAVCKRSFTFKLELLLQFIVLLVQVHN